MTTPDPRRQVIARIETDSFPAGAYDTLTDGMLDTLWVDWGLTGGCWLVEVDADGRTVEDRLRARVAELEGELRDHRDAWSTAAEEGREILGEALAAQRAIRDAVAVLGDDTVNIDRVAEALRVLRRGLGQMEPAPQVDR